MEDFEDFVPSIIDTNSSNGSFDNITFYQPSKEVIIMLSVLYGSLSLVTVLSNSMVIYIYMSSSRPMQPILDYLIANLALADLMIGLICIPFSFQAALLQSWNHLPDFLCWVLPFVENMSLNVSIFSLTAIAIDR